MTRTWRLGRVAGVDVQLDWTVGVIFCLVAVLLGADQFPSQFPGQPPWAYALSGFAVAVMFFLGLLAHELAHAVVARRSGVEVEGITLWMLGGMARLHREPRTASDDFRIAAAGPAVSALLGGGFIVVAVVLAAAGWSGLPVVAIGWLAAVNLMLATFNLLPAASLDGGRILRAAVWWWSGDRDRASGVATRAGRLLGATLLALGVRQYLSGAGVAGLWTSMLGWFVLATAKAEAQAVTNTGVAAGLRVRQVMSGAPVTLQAHVTVSELIDTYLWSYRHSAFPVLDGPELVGLVTLNRVKRVPPGLRAMTPLRAIAIPVGDLVLTDPDESLDSLLRRLQGKAEGRALVLDDEQRLVGIVTPTDLSRALQSVSLAAAR
jgi:Zn-dependent protease